MEFTNQLKKYIRSLHIHKYRQKYNKFIVEGPKICDEYLQGPYTVSHIICTTSWHSTHISPNYTGHYIVVNSKTLQQISNLKTANQVLCLVDMPKENPPIKNQWSIYLDKIQDPGNMGTIIRTADWYGITQIIISSDSVDVYNPKVVQSSMGSHNRHIFHSLNASALINLDFPLYGLTLDGEPIEHVNLEPGIIIIGNESKGIRPEIIKRLDQKLTITKRGQAESLNAAVACGIACHLLLDS